MLLFQTITEMSHSTTKYMYIHTQPYQSYIPLQQHICTSLSPTHHAPDLIKTLKKTGQETKQVQSSRSSKSKWTLNFSVDLSNNFWENGKEGIRRRGQKDISSKCFQLWKELTYYSLPQFNIQSRENWFLTLPPLNFSTNSFIQTSCQALISYAMNNDRLDHTNGSPNQKGE